MMNDRERIELEYSSRIKVELREKDSSEGVRYKFLIEGLAHAEAVKIAALLGELRNAG